MAGHSTPATILLRTHGVEHSVHSYTTHSDTPNRKGASYGLEAAEALDVPPERLFKTLVADVGGELVVGVLPVSAQLDLKAIATTQGAKKAKLADTAVAERATGYVAGGISPLGHKKSLPVVVDPLSQQFDRIYCSAGRRGLQIELAPADLIRLTDATVATISG